MQSYILFHYILSLLLTSILTLILGIFVYFKNKKAKVNRSFFLFSLSISIWSYFQIRMSLAPNESLSLFFGRIEYFGVILIPAFFLHFVYALLELDVPKRKWLAISDIFCLLFLTCLPFKLFIPITEARLFSKYIVNPGPMHHLFLIYFAVVVTIGLYELFKAYADSSGARRNQMKYLSWAAFLGFLGGSTNYLYVYGRAVSALNPFGNYGVPFYVLVTAYAIVKHRLMDISVIIKKTVIYGVIYSFSLAVFMFLTIFVGQRLIYGHLDGRFYALSMLSILIITLSLKPLDNLLIRLTDKYLFREKYEYQKTLRAASDGMTRIRSLPKLLDLIVRMIVNSVRITQATIFLADKERPIFITTASRGKFKVPKGFIRNNANSPLVTWLSKKKEPLVYDEIMSQLKRENILNANLRSNLERISREMQDLRTSICIPSFIENKMTGFLMLGEKLSGDMYTQEDLDFFATLANQAALAIENAQSYEELKDTHDQLLQSERLATIGKFANEVAHEIKNPLQAIRTFVEYLPQKYDDKEFREKFTKIASGEIERIDTFVSQLAGFSKSKPLEFSPVDINQLLDTTLLLLENDFREKKVLIKRRYFKKELKFLTDRNQLKQVFLNLFLNSLDAMDNSKPNQLTVETYLENQHLLIKITDTGCGISRENLPHLFEPFFTTKEKGTGLGLAIVKSIIENHNGTISVTSDVGKGTAFYMSFPYLDKK